MSRAAHRLCRRAAGYLRDLADWLGERAEALEKAGSYERRRPLRFETKWEGAMRKMSERMLVRCLDDLLAVRPDVNIPCKQPSSEDLRRSLKAYRYER